VWPFLRYVIESIELKLKFFKSVKIITNGLLYEELKKMNQNLEELKKHMIKATSQQPSEPKEPL